MSEDLDGKGGVASKDYAENKLKNRYRRGISPWQEAFQVGNFSRLS